MICYSCLQFSTVYPVPHILSWYTVTQSNVLHTVIQSVKGFSVVSEREADVCLEFPGFLYNPANVGNLISGSPAFSKPNLDIWNFSIHVMLKPSMQDFEYNLSSMKDECNCPMVLTFFITPLLGNWDEDWHFPVLWPLLGFPNLLTYWVQHFDSIIFQDLK